MLTLIVAAALAAPLVQAGLPPGITRAELLQLRPWMDAALPVDARVQALLPQMTLAEKIAQTQAGNWPTTPDELCKYGVNTAESERANILIRGTQTRNTRMVTARPPALLAGVPR
jgi:alpha-beta hydrolase superfamily lysophospholipase